MKAATCHLEQVNDCFSQVLDESTPQPQSLDLHLVEAAGPRLARCPELAHVNSVVRTTAGSRVRPDGVARARKRRSV